MDGMIMGFAVVAAAVSALIFWLGKRCGKTLSAYKIFGIVDVILGIVIVIISIIDIVTPGGDLNGLLGQVLLMVYVPEVIILLIADIVLYNLVGKKKQ